MTSVDTDGVISPATPSPLFRPEVVRAHSASPLGTILLGRPISLTVFAIGGIVVISALLGLLCFGVYTKRAHVTGYLVPDIGLVKVYAPQSAQISQMLVVDGQTVKRGDTLYVLIAPRDSSAGAVDANVLSRLAARKASLEAESAQQRDLTEVNRKSLEQRAAQMQGELNQLAQEIELQKRRMEHAEATANRFQSLQRAGAVAVIQAQEKMDEWLDLKARSIAAERSHSQLLRDREAIKEQLQSLPLTANNQLARIQRDIAEIEQDIEEAVARHDMVVRAPVDGVATTVLARPGQWIRNTTPLLSIVPTGSTLEAHLFSPSRSVGFIHAGQKVLLRYQSYPYQKFGQYEGTVISVSRSALKQEDLSSPLLEATDGSKESQYLITVKLGSQYITAYGKNEPLQPDMLVDADILQDRRRLIEWVLEPIYSVKGQL